MFQLALLAEPVTIMKSLSVQLSSRFIHEKFIGIN